MSLRLLVLLLLLVPGAVAAQDADPPDEDEPAEDEPAEASEEPRAERPDPRKSPSRSLFGGPESDEFPSEKGHARVGLLLGGIVVAGRPCDPFENGCAPVDGDPSRYHFVQTHITAPTAPGISLSGAYWPLPWLGPYARWELYNYRTDYDVVTRDGEERKFGDTLNHIQVGAQGRLRVMGGRIKARARVGYHAGNTTLFRRVVDTDNQVFVATYERRWLHAVDLGVGLDVGIIPDLVAHLDYDLSMSLSFPGPGGHRLDAGATYRMGFLKGWASNLFAGLDFHLWTRGYRLSFTFGDPPPIVAEPEQKGEARERGLGVRIAVGYRFD